MQANPERRTFQTLDGLRAVGALLVVMRHAPMYFPHVHVPESFLAVDLFYLVSGFVVAHAYGDRLKAGRFGWMFFKTRLIRLYPLYLAGLALGVIAASLSVLTDPAGWWTWPKLLEAVATGVLMVPLLPGLGANGSSLDGPTWTLLPELIANMVYAIGVRFMRIPVLAAIIAVSGWGLYLAEQKLGTLDVGFGADQFWAALARVGFSFFAGVLIYRLAGRRQLHSNLAACVCLAALTVILALRPGEEQSALYELAVVMLGFPLLVLAAVLFEPGPATGRVFAKLGLWSYGVYLLHLPLANLSRVLIGRDRPLPTDLKGLAMGAVFTLVLLGLAALLDQAYDAPVRKVLRNRFLKR